MMNALKANKQDPKKKTPSPFHRAEARSQAQKIAEPQKSARGISLNFTFTALVDERLGEVLFLKHETHENYLQNFFTSENKRDGFVLMSRNEIVINCSKVKFVSNLNFVSSISFDFVLFISKTKSCVEIKKMHFDEPTRALVHFSVLMNSFRKHVDGFSVLMVFSLEFYELFDKNCSSNRMTILNNNFQCK